MALNMIGELCKNMIGNICYFEKRQYIQDGDTTRAQNVSILPTVDKLP